MPEQQATPEEVVSSADYENVAKFFLEEVITKIETVDQGLAAAQVNATLAVAVAIRENAQGCCLNRPYPQASGSEDPWAGFKLQFPKAAQD